MRRQRPSRHEVAPTGKGFLVGACSPRDGLGIEWAKKPKPSRHEVAPTGRCFFVGACLPREGLGFEWAKKLKPSRHEVAPTGRCFFVGACLPRDGGVLVFGFPDSRLLTQFSGLSPPVSSSHFNFKEPTQGAGPWQPSLD